MRVRYVAIISSILLALSTLACDRLPGTSGDDDQQARWADELDAHGPPPSADDGEPLDGDRAVAVLTPKETTVGKKTLSKNPTVMELAQLLKSETRKGADWVVWADPEVTVRRLARFVQKLEMAGDDPTVHLAVDVASGKGDPTIRGVPLAPADSSELAASNAWAVHAPAKTKVGAFLEKYRQRRHSKDEQLEDFSE